MKGIQVVMQKANPGKLEDGEQGNMVARFEDNRKEVKIRNYDERMVEIYKNIKNLPYSGHIHPNVFLKLSRYLVQFSKEKRTLYEVMAEDEPSAIFCETIMLMLLESKLLGSENITGYLEPIIEFGTIHSTMICAAYLLPELPNRPEEIRVVYRYEDDIRLTTDRIYLKDVLELKGLGLNKEGVVIVKKDNITVWDALFRGAYKPKNGNYNDIREANLTK